MIDHEILAVREGVLQDHALVHAEVVPVDAAAGAVHAPLDGADPVVQQFAGQTGEHRAFGRLEAEAGNGGGVLAEVHHQGFAGIQVDGLPFREFPLDGDGAVADLIPDLGFHRIGNALPDIGLDGIQRDVGAQIDLSALGGQDLALEFGVQFRLGEFLGRGIAGQDAAS